jgi:tartrate-resistant acid phosphatase type 5
MRIAICIALVLATGCDDQSPTNHSQMATPDMRASVDRDAARATPDQTVGMIPLDSAITQDLAVVDAMRTMENDGQANAPDAVVIDATPPPEPVVMRFAALGDTGKGNDGQRRVAAALADACTQYGGCRFAILLGDNIYDSGAEDAQDPQWDEKFQDPYADVDMPFYATLGNHDYGAPAILQSFAGGIGVDPTRGQAQLDYAAQQDKFRMPSSFYRFSEGPVELVSLNTASMFWRDLTFIEDITGFALINDQQEETLPQWAANPLASWRIAFGHHPYLSNGRHGNAGSYDFVFIPGLPGSGTALREFMETYVIGEFDVYLAGHDHNLQDLGEHEGTQVIVSGAGASTRELRPQNPSLYEAESLGFVLVEATEASLNFRFIEVNEDDGAARLWVEAYSRRIAR